MPEFSAQLPAWHSGLERWLTVGEIPELAALLGTSARQSAPECDVEQVDAVEVDVDVNPQPQASAASSSSSSWGATGAPRRMQAVDAEERPASHLVWNILATVCCCLPLGVIGIIFSAKVNSAWLSGDIDAAKAASEKAAWCFILSFTLGLMMWPLQLMLM